MEKEKHIFTNNNGCPVVDDDNTKTAGPKGPALLEDYQFVEKLAHFDRERIPERVVHAVGGGAFGHFVATNTEEIKKYTYAKVFTEAKPVEVFARFSTVAGSRGSSDEVRDPRGFAIRLYTTEGNLDIVGNNTPVFFIRDAKKFPDFIHTQKMDPKTDCKNPDAQWDFWGLSPESLHQVLILFSNRGIPYGFRHMHGYGTHTFTFINDKNERFFIKYHWRCQQGIRNFNKQEIATIPGQNPQFAKQDLYDAIARGDYPKWKLCIQVMTEEQAKNYRYNIFDATKVWSHKDFPLIEVGEMVLDRNPENYFESVEQAGFTPANIVPGIGFSSDKMLQGRLFSYSDTQRYRVGTNYMQLDVNKPHGCPIYNYMEDGKMANNSHLHDGINYQPNSLANYEFKPYDDLSAEIEEKFTPGYYDQDEDYYSQPRAFIEVLKKQGGTEYQDLVDNIADSLKLARKQSIDRMLGHFGKICPQFEADVKKAMNYECGNCGCGKTGKCNCGECKCCK